VIDPWADRSEERRKKKDDFLPRKKSSFMQLLRPALPADENFSPFFAFLTGERSTIPRAKLSVVCLMTQAKIMVSLLM
jgi:hypothetical protein